MRRRWKVVRLVGAALVLASAFPVVACARQEGSAVGRAVEALEQEYNAAYGKFMEAYRKAGTDEERQKLFQTLYPQPASFAPRFLEAAQKDPKDPAALRALQWILTRAPTSGQATQAVALIGRYHLESPEIKNVAMSLIYGGPAGSEDLLKGILERNPDRQARAYACYALGKRYLVRGDSQAAEPYMERVVREFGDVPSPYGRGLLKDRAERDLYEIRHLAIGKVAPEIVGEDIEGRPMKLSDFRGKVVVLDFWGHW